MRASVGVPRVATSRARHLVFSGLCFLSTAFSRLEADVAGVLKQDATIRSGKNQILISKGSSLCVLKTGESVCVVSLTLPDGTPVITQIPSALISLADSSRNDEIKKQSVVKVDATTDTRAKAAEPTVFHSESTEQVQVSPPVGPDYPRFKLPSESSESILPNGQYTVQTGTFVLPINDAFASVVYAIPMRGREVAKSASNLVFYGPYPNERTRLNGNIVPNLVKKLGCAVFSFQIEGIGQSVSREPYWSKEAGWFEAALRARKMLIKAFALEPRKLILVGYSGGGGMVMNFAGAYPDQIEAVAAQAPDVVPPFPHENKIKWLMVVNRGDPNRSIMKPFYNQLAAEHCEALYCETTPDRSRAHYHAPSDQTFGLIYSFIAGILDQRRLASEGIDDIGHLWPFAAPSSPLQRYAIVKTSNLTQDDLQNGHFDFLPSLAFTMRWSQVCPPEQNVKVGKSHARLTLNFPSRATPAGIILYYDNPSYADIPREVEDINSLAEHGYLVISTMTADPEGFIDAASEWVKSEEKLRGLHIHLVGNGVAGARFISKVAARNDITFRSLSVIDFGDSWLEADCSDQVTLAAKECGMYGFYSYSDSDDDSFLKMWAAGLVDRSAQGRGCFNFCSKPVDNPPLAKALRHTQAEDQALSMIKALIARADAQ